MFLRHWKVFYKLLALIVVSVLFLGAIGYIGINQTRLTYNGVDEMYTDRLLPVQWMNAARAHNRAIEANTFRILLSSDPEEQKELIADIDRRVAEFDVSIVDFKNGGLDSYEAELVTKLEALSTEYNWERTKAIELRINPEWRDPDLAYQQFVNGALPHLNKLNGILTELSGYQSEKAEQLDAQLLEDFQSSSMFMMIFMGAAVVLIVCIGLWISNMIVAPVRRLQLWMKEASEGNLTVDAKIAARDELGQLTSSFSDMLASLRSVLRQVTESTEMVAASSEQLTANAEQTGKSSEMITSVAQELASGSEQQAAAVRDTLQKADDIAEASGRMNGNVAIMRTTVADAAEKSREGMESMNVLSRKMGDLHASIEKLSSDIRDLGSKSDNIGAVMRLISDIAEQTNLLSMNAAIEASRAGEHGRGFAVVAQEVRKLSVQSTASAQEVASQVTEIRSGIAEASRSMKSASLQLQEGMVVVNESVAMFEGIAESAGLVDDQTGNVSHDVEEVMKRVDEIVRSLRTISDVAEQAAAGTQHVSAATEQQLASMEDMVASSSHLSTLSSELQEKVNRFVV